jgi:hypothetical protein
VQVEKVAKSGVFAFVLCCHPEPSAPPLRDGGEGPAVAFVAQSFALFAKFCGLRVY